jgi:hypothetical protein
MDIQTLNADQCIALIAKLEQVLDARQHKRIHLGEEITVSGSLSKALKLSELQRKLQRYKNTDYASYKDQLEKIWLSLSNDTRQHVLELLHWYDYHDLDWDDPRSNRKPNLD